MTKFPKTILIPTTIPARRTANNLNSCFPKKNRPLCILIAFAAMFFFEGILLAQDFPHERAEQENRAARFFDGEKVRELQILTSGEANSQKEICVAQFFSKTRYFNLHFSNNALFALKSAAASYNSDFESKKLSAKDKKSLAKYGRFSTQIEWGTSRKNMTQISHGASATFGYAFVKKSPYFAISIQSAQSETESSKALENSGNATLLFTKAQLANFISQIEQLH